MRVIQRANDQSNIQLPTVLNAFSTLRSHLWIQINYIPQSTWLRSRNSFVWMCVCVCVGCIFWGYIFTIDRATVDAHTYLGTSIRNLCNLICHQTEKPSDEWQWRKMRKYEQMVMKKEIKTPDEAIGNCDTIFRVRRMVFRARPRTCKRHQLISPSRVNCKKKNTKNAGRVTSVYVCVEFPFSQLNDFEVGETAVGAIHKWPSSARLDHNRLQMSYTSCSHIVVAKLYRAMTYNGIIWALQYISCRKVNSMC